VVYATYLRTHNQATSNRREASELPKGAIRAGSPLFFWGVGDWGVILGCCNIFAAYRFSLVDLRRRRALEIQYQAQLRALPEIGRFAAFAGLF
jgi:hypothetical protein